MKFGQNANRLFDFVKVYGELKSDAQLAEKLGIMPSQLCNIRARRVNLGPTIIVRLMETYETLSLRQIYELLKEE
jgi:hypothetical protein